MVTLFQRRPNSTSLDGASYFCFKPYQRSNGQLAETLSERDCKGQTGVGLQTLLKAFAVGSLEKNRFWQHNSKAKQKNG